MKSALCLSVKRVKAVLVAAFLVFASQTVAVAWASDELGDSTGSVVIPDGGELAKCSGLFVRDDWFVTAHHCLLNVSDPTELTIVGSKTYQVIDMVLVQGRDLAFLRVDTDDVEQCIDFSERTVSQDAGVSVLTRDLMTNAPKTTAMKVNSLYHRTEIEDLDLTSNLLLLDAPQGKETVEGDSGAGVVVSHSESGPELLGVIVGLSQNGNGVLVEPLDGVQGSFEFLSGTCSKNYQDFVWKTSSKNALHYSSESTGFLSVLLLILSSLGLWNALFV